MEKTNENQIISNYKEFKEKLKNIKNSGIRPTLLLHVCCAPCSTYVLDLLKDYFEVTLYYYNPNIYPESEYQMRKMEFLKLPKGSKILYGEYEVRKYIEAIEEYKDLGEFSPRCYQCYNLRMEETAKYAKSMGFDYFTTTLSVSPYKNQQWINEIGYAIQDKYKIAYLYSNFKKSEGYKKSVRMSNKAEMYRQEYCGCQRSLEDSLRKKDI